MRTVLVYILTVFSMDMNFGSLTRDFVSGSSTARHRSDTERDVLLATKLRQHKNSGANDNQLINLAGDIQRFLNRVASENCEQCENCAPLRKRALIPWSESVYEGKGVYSLWPQNFTVAEYCPQYSDNCDMVPTPVVMRKYFLQTYNEVTSEPGLSYPLWSYRLAYVDIMVAALCARQA